MVYLKNMENLNEDENSKIEKQEAKPTLEENNTSFVVKDNKTENHKEVENKIGEIKDDLEKAYNSENTIENSKIEKDFVVEMLKKNGLEDLETKKLFNDYLDQQQELRDSNEDIDASQIFNIRHSMDMTDFYIAIGDNEGALENIDEALDQAEHYKLEDLVLEIKNKRKELLKN